MATIAVVGGIVAWQIIARTYEPLTTHNFGVRDFEDLSHRGRALLYDHGRTFLYFFDVTNSGDHAITITGVERPLRPERDMEFLIDQTGILMARGLGLENAPPIPFEAFELSPDESRRIYVEARFANCRGWWANDTMRAQRETIQYSFLGVESRMSLRLVAPLVIRGPERDDCPQRKHPR